MPRIVDVSRVQAALDRAARNAVHGSREVRAGRLVAGDASARLPAGKPRPTKLAPSSGPSGPRAAAQHNAEKRSKVPSK
jgi:hypothetical protein